MNNHPTPFGKRLMSFSEKETICEYRFRNSGPFWHLTTPGQLQEILFITENDYRFGMSSAAICAAETGIVIYANTLMGNHIHDLVEKVQGRPVSSTYPEGGKGSRDI